MANPYGDNLNSLAQSEHISPDKTGDNIEAKRVANYIWNGSTWARDTGSAGLVPGTDFDYIDGQQTSATVDTYVYKTGGSGGTTVQTITVTYTSSAKTDIDSVSYA